MRDETTPSEHPVGGARDPAASSVVPDSSALPDDEMAVPWRVFEQAVIGVGLTDGEGLIIRSNSALEAFLGYSAEELRGRALTEVIHPDDVEKGAAEIRAVLCGESDHALGERLYMRKDGRRVWGRSSIGPIMDAAGRLLGCVALVEDIDEGREVKRRLSQERALLRRVIDAVPGIIFVKDRAGRYVLVNEALARFFGATIASMVGTTDFDHDFMAGAVDLPRLHQENLEVMDGRTAFGSESHLADAQGTLHWFETVKIPLLEDDGSCDHFLFVSNEVTETKLREGALLAGERRFRLIADSMPEIVFTVDPDGRSDFINARFEEYAGIEPSTEQALIVPVHPDDVQPTLGAWRHSISTGEILQIEQRLRSAAGDYRRFLTRAVPVRDLSGVIIKWCGSAVDIEDEKQAEQVRLELQRQQSQKMESLGQLAGGIAHDFNNLLTAVIGYSNLILGGYDRSPEAVRVDVEEIRRAAESASALTRQILAFSRRQPLRPETVSLNDVVLELADLLRRTLGERIELVTALEPGLGLAEVDPAQLIHVVVNLTLNARDAMPTGGCLTIETSDADLDEAYCARHPDAVSGPYVLLAVSDTGVGMDAQTASRIFDPFFTTKTRGQGTGLGLSTVHGIVAQSGGSIAVSSEPGRGARFEIYLPRVTGEVVDPASSRGPQPVPAIPRGQETVLVVEDESAVRHLVERILSREGYTVLVAGDAGEAEILLRQSQPIHLLLTDVVLPGRMQGNDVAELAIAAHPHLPVLYMSGYPRDAIVSAGRLHAGVNYLDKPFSPSILVERIRELLDREADSRRSEK